MSKNTPNSLQLAEEAIWQMQDTFDRVRVDMSLNFQREAEFAMQILTKNDFTLTKAVNDPQSLKDAIINVASIGISLNPAAKLAYLVPRDGKVCLDISYMGMVELAILGGAITFAQSRIVHAKDRYIDNGPGLVPTHEYDAFSKDRGVIVGAYVAAKLPTGDFLSETMAVDAINDIRDRSEYYKKSKKGPWVTDWAEMARKTVVKRAAKYWRGYGSTERLDKAISYLNQNGEGFGEIHGNEPPPPPPPTSFDVMAFVKRAEEQTNEKDLTAVYSEGMRVAMQFQDRAGAAYFKAKALAHRAKMRAALDANTIDMEHREAA